MLRFAKLPTGTTAAVSGMGESHLKGLRQRRRLVTKAIMFIISASTATAHTNEVIFIA